MHYNQWNLKHCNKRLSLAETKIQLIIMQWTTCNIFSFQKLSPCSLTDQPSDLICNRNGLPAHFESTIDELLKIMIQTICLVNNQ